jgi:hypothetical protein
VRPDENDKEKTTGGIREEKGVESILKNDISIKKIDINATHSFFNIHQAVQDLSRINTKRVGNCYPETG